MIQTKRDRAIITGLYLSKFDRAGLEALGFSGFIEAYNTLGLSLGVKPASLKNYRDEFDAVFPNPRKGWQNRPMREYCKRLYDEFGGLNFNSFDKLLKSFVLKDFDIEEIVGKTESRDSETVAKRLLTGKAAEEYFKKEYKAVAHFNEFELKDTTNLACGFDFKLSNNSDFYCVEVKGLSGTSGSITLTEKEFDVAKTYTNQFCLFVVMNFIEKPYHDCIFDPLHSRLTFKKAERQVTQISYLTAI